MEGCGGHENGSVCTAAKVGMLLVGDGIDGEGKLKTNALIFCL